MAHADQIERGVSPAAAGLTLAALILLGTRFVQGFIFWGGASRRLIYDFHDVAGVDHAVKLDFEVPGFVAAKLTHALPGARTDGHIGTDARIRGCDGASFGTRVPDSNVETRRRRFGRRSSRRAKTRRATRASLRTSSSPRRSPPGISA